MLGLSIWANNANYIYSTILWRLRERYRNTLPCLQASHFSHAVAFETLGPINQSGVDFISEIGCRLEQADARERCFLFQRLSITVQRFNFVALRGSFCAQSDLNTR